MTPKDHTSYAMISDIIILLFAGVVFITYQYEKNLAPEYLLFSVQLLILWFALRIIFRIIPQLKGWILIGVLGWTVFESIWGLGQLYDYWPSKHALFKTTGSFFNSGPFGGFIALAFPLVLHGWLEFRSKNKIIGYLFLAAGAICLMVFPATLSRTAWIASIAGCIIVLLSNRHIKTKFLLFWEHRKKQCTIGVAILSLFFVIAFYGIYHLKKDSANGRLFMWKITALAIKESPIRGTGIGGFPAAYAEAQMSYFKSGKGNETEKMVAGSPEYAFNEYLQFFLEQGLAGFILFLILIFFIIKSGIENHQIGAVGSFITLSVFAFASYPFQLWQFPVIWVLLGVICTDETDCNKRSSSVPANRKRTCVLFMLLGILCVLSTYCASHQKIYYRAKKEWNKLQPLYSVKAYKNVKDNYSSLYHILNYEPKFVFEYGVILNGVNKHKEADSILSRGLERSCDPMFYNVKGRNFHEMGEYKKAEDCFIQSIWLLPERIYPYYLLTKLYADSANYQPEKMKQSAMAVLEKEPKVQSTAVKEMRNEVKKILQSASIKDKE